MDYDNYKACLYTSGSGTSYLTDERVNKIMDAVSDRGLTEGDDFKASAAFLEAVGDCLIEGIPDEEAPNEEIPEKQYVSPKPVPNSLSLAEAIVGAIISGIIGLSFYTQTKEKHQGYPEPVEFEYRRNSIINLGITDDSLVNTYITTRIIPEPDPPSYSSSNNSSGYSYEISSDSGRSTTHISSSGSTHGGGGRSFTGGSTTHSSSSGSSHGGGGRKF
jgi:uncharacterized protein